MLNDKQLDKIHSKLGKHTVEELDKLDVVDLRERIVVANAAMKQADDELQANEKYQELKRSKSALEQGKKDVNARQNAVIKYCLHLLEEKGDATLSEEEANG